VTSDSVRDKDERNEGEWERGVAHLFCDHELGVVDAGVRGVAAGVGGDVEETDGDAAGC